MHERFQRAHDGRWMFTMNVMGKCSAKKMASYPKDLTSPCTEQSSASSSLVLWGHTLYEQAPDAAMQFIFLSLEEFDLEQMTVGAEI